MTREPQQTIHQTSEGGKAANHPPAFTHAARVGPTTTNELNTLKLALVPIACWGLYDTRFEFGSSFVRPQAREELGFLSVLRKAHPGAPLSVFGHADPVGSDSYNKRVSGRRAMTIYALLVRDTDLWEHLYSSHQECNGGDTWGLRSLQTMLTEVGFPSGQADGKMNEETQKALHDFQRQKGLPQTGKPDKPTRKKLFAAYMDRLCVDETGKPFRLEKENFLAQGADKDGKGDYQGCSRFNPVLLFSQKETVHFEQVEDKRARNAENEPNRRVVIYLFRPGAKVQAAKWPCPKAKDGPGGCIARFWSDHTKRRQFGAKRRTYTQDKDTFACRFYERLANFSPCETPTVAPTMLVRLHDVFGRLMPGVEYALEGAGPSSSFHADDEAFAVVPLQGEAEQVTLRWDRVRSESGDAPQFQYAVNLFVLLLDPESEQGIRRRLHNLGYPIESEFESSLRHFQSDQELALTGRADTATKAKLTKIYNAILYGFEEPSPATLPNTPADDRRT